MLGPLLTSACGDSRNADPDAPTGPPDARQYNCECTFANPDKFAIPGCEQAMMLAVRHQDGILMQQADVERFHRLVDAVNRAEPGTTGAYPNRQYAGSSMPVYSTYEPLVSAWSQGTLLTGEALIDAAFAANATGVVYDGYLAQLQIHQFRVEFPTLASFVALDQVVEQIPETWPGEYEFYDVNTTIYAESLSEPVQLFFRAGWGVDCQVGCPDTHAWRATVTDDLEVSVTDLGGDPVPPVDIDINEYFARCPAKQ